MNKLLMTGALLVAGGMVTLPAYADSVFYDNAKVLSVTPQTERVNNPRRECHTEYIQESVDSGDRDVGGAILGGIAGGIIGSQVGKGNGRVAAAAVGAAAGAIVGDRIDNSDQQSGSYRTRPVERCVMVDNWQTITRNYLVSYRYNGHDYTTTLAYDPGNNLRVRVAVVPDEGRGDIVSYVPGYPSDNYPPRRGWGRHDRGRDWDD